MLDVRKKQQGDFRRPSRPLARQTRPAPLPVLLLNVEALLDAAEAVIRMLHFNAPPVVKAAAGDEDVYKVLILDRHTKVCLCAGGGS